MNQNMIDNLKTYQFADHILHTSQGPGIGGFLSQFNIIKSDKQTKVLKENEHAFVRAEFLAEGKAPKTTDNSLAEVWLNPKRVITAIELSQELMENTAVNQKQHLHKVATRRIQSATERMITFSGYTGSSGSIETNENMQLLSRGGNNFVSTHTSDEEILEYSLIKRVYSDFTRYENNPKTAFWLFTDSSTQVLDAQGNDLVTYDNLPDGAFGMLLGMPMYRASLPISSYDRQVACILVAPEAYTVLLGETKVQQIQGDTTQEIRNSTVLKFEQWVDGKITNMNGRFGIEFAKS